MIQSTEGGANTSTVNDGNTTQSHTNTKISTIIFDVDDTLYDVGTGFTAHRNTDGATSFMIDKLHFSSREEAQMLRDVYFAQYHSTAKGLTAAEADGKLPPLPDGVNLPSGRTNRFDPEELDEYWAERLNFSLLGGPDPECVKTFELIRNKNYGDLTIVGFSNGPRKYVSRVMREIGLDLYFTPNNLFAVNDVLPYCKPDLGSFKSVLDKVGALPQQCIIVEDSMKNIRAAKALGMTTILVVGKGRRREGRNGALQQNPMMWKQPRLEIFPMNQTRLLMPSWRWLQRFEMSCRNGSI